MIAFLKLFMFLCHVDLIFVLNLFVISIKAKNFLSNFM